MHTETSCIVRHAQKCGLDDTAEMRWPVFIHCQSAAHLSNRDGATSVVTCGRQLRLLGVLQGAQAAVHALARVLERQRSLLPFVPLLPQLRNLGARPLKLRALQVWISLSYT